MISLRAMAELPPDEPRHLRVYHEDYGPVLWWTRPISEPPWVGSPLYEEWPGYHQWWTPLPPMPPKLCRDWHPSPNRPVVPEERSDGEG